MPIGKVTIALEAQHAALTKGLQQGRVELKGFGDSASSMASTIRTAFAALAAGASVAALKGLTTEVINSTTSAWRLSEVLGITVGSLQELQVAASSKAGLGAEEFNATFQKMIKNLGGIGEDTDKARGALTALGISAEKIAGMKADEAFKSIAQAISQMKSPTDQASAAVAIFGKQGQSLLPLFQEGAAGLDEAAASARRTGQAMSEIDAAKLVNAHKAFDDIGNATEGIKNQLVIALAPVLTEIAQDILAWIPPAERMRSAFVGGLQAVATGVAYLMDTYNILKGVVLSVAFAGVGAFELLLRGVQALADGLVWVTNKLFHTKYGTPAFITESVNAVAAMRQSIGQDMHDAFTAPSHVEGVTAFFDSVTSKAEDAAKKLADGKHNLGQPLADGFESARKQITDTLAKMRAEVDDFGLSAGQKQLKELLNNKNATPLDIFKATDLAVQLKQLEDWKTEQADAKKLIEETTSPLEKYQNEIDKISVLFQDGLINTQQYYSAIGKANKDLQSSFADKGETKKVGAETRRFDFAGPKAAPERASGIDGLLQESKSQSKTLEQSNKYLAEIYRFQQNADNTPDELVTY